MGRGGTDAGLLGGAADRVAEQPLVTRRTGGDELVEPDAEPGAACSASQDHLPEAARSVRRGLGLQRIELWSSSRPLLDDGLVDGRGISKIDGRGVPVLLVRRHTRLRPETGLRECGAEIADRLRLRRQVHGVVNLDVKACHRYRLPTITR